MLADRLAFMLGANLRRGDRPGAELRRRALNGPGLPSQPRRAREPGRPGCHEVCVRFNRATLTPWRSLPIVASRQDLSSGHHLTGQSGSVPLHLGAFLEDTACSNR